jgi:hypothetical protein
MNSPLIKTEAEMAHNHNECNGKEKCWRLVPSAHYVELEQESSCFSHQKRCHNLTRNPSLLLHIIIMQEASDDFFYRWKLGYLVISNLLKNIKESLDNGIIVMAPTTMNQKPIQ